MRTLQEIQPGQTLGRYEFLVPIAEGGMASVWAARLRGSRGFSKTVAVKTMLPSVSDDPQFEQMFLDEAQIASRIRHPNVVEILDLGEEDEVLYLVMEWVDGEPLSNLRRAAAKHGGIPRNIAVRIIADASAGLHAAHELKDEAGQLVGLVHRDISPQNVLITFDGVVKIVDFGVAKAAGRSTGQTTAGQVKGKPPYMSPEQALGEPVDRRTDVFALGIILYQLTTGKHPFRGESDLVTLQNIVSDKPVVPPRAYDKQYPRALEALLMKALDRDREARFQTCAELESAIDHAFGAEMPRARTEDVAKFMREMLGSRGEDRRKALLESIRAADARTAGRASLPEVPPSRPVDSSTFTPLDSSAGFEIVGGAAESSEARSAKVTPYGATIPAPMSSRRSRAPVAAAAGLAMLLGVGAFVALRSPARPAGAKPSSAMQAAPRPEQRAMPAPPPPEPAPAVAGSAPEPLEIASAAASAPEPEPLHAPDGKTARHAARRPVPQTAAKPVVSPGTKPSRKSTFVPPPVSDPGF